MKSIKVALLAVASLLLFLSVPGLTKGGRGSLELDKSHFEPGETIQVHFVAPMGLPENAWVGLIPSDVPHGSEATNDDNDMAYQYLSGRISGTLSFTAPGQSGYFDFRMNESDSGGEEIAYVSFSVGSAGAYDSGGGASLRLERKSYNPGEPINVRFTAPAGLPENAWVGLIPSNIPHGDEATNDQHDITYQYLKGRTSGALVFTAPAQPGNYDFRMNDRDDNGREIASVSFSVGGAEMNDSGNGASLALEKYSFSPGEEIRVRFTAPAGLAENAWVGLIPSNVAHGDEATNDQYDMTYQYLKGRTSGVLVFTAPAQPGNYDFRMNDTDNNGREIASVSFRVN